jgi:hypothetical protein
MQERWLPCKIQLKTRGGKPRRAYLVLLDAFGVLEPRAGVVLLVRHPSGATFQIPGRVSRRLSRGYVEIYIPADAGLTLAAQMGITPEKSTTVYGYAAQIKSINPPPP